MDRWGCYGGGMDNERERKTKLLMENWQLDEKRGVRLGRDRRRRRQLIQMEGGSEGGMDGWMEG